VQHSQSKGGEDAFRHPTPEPKMDEANNLLAAELGALVVGGRWVTSSVGPITLLPLKPS
jgi:hypothetical protein